MAQHKICSACSAESTSRGSLIRKPRLIAFLATRRFPAAVRGPVDNRHGFTRFIRA
jgi:hypothetical protein